MISSILFATIHVPYFYIIGMLSGMLSMVPYLGVVLALVPPWAQARSRATFCRNR